MCGIVEDSCLEPFKVYFCRAMNGESDSLAAASTQAFGEQVIDDLRALGVSHFVVSPGSRSTPLTLAIARLGDEFSTVVLDERSAAFHALGRIKATAEPVAVVCTSGSAGAQYYGAVLEAEASGLPLLLLTADRPPELQKIHAGQTIDQRGLFGRHVVYEAQLPLPEAGNAVVLRQTRELLRQGMAAALTEPGGAVHFNIPYREPFISKGTGPGLSSRAPVRLQRTSVKPTTFPAMELPERTLILAGPRAGLVKAAELEALAALSARTGWPLLADGVNPLRSCDTDLPYLISNYDSILRDENLRDALRPEAVILWGEPPTSKVLRQWLMPMGDRLRALYLGAETSRINPLLLLLEVLPNPQVALETLACGTSESGYGESWKKEAAATELKIAEQLAETAMPFEGPVIRRLGEILPEGSPVVFANSLSVRMAEWFLPRRRAGIMPFSQRGANGIDGTVSLARGIGNALARPVRLVAGDLALLHDSNGLLGMAGADLGLQVILFNNRGGGIFEYLPVAEHEAFERWFATPQEVDFESLARMHGGAYQKINDLNGLGAGLLDWKGKGLSILEIPLDREESRTFHQQVLNS
jgi:2-succinyl-5-enolpyruvyl-6-hydroxy-3-cyclohexene-1-carboxylate synthase